MKSLLPLLLLLMLATMAKSIIWWRNKALSKGREGELIFFGRKSSHDNSLEGPDCHVQVLTKTSLCFFFVWKYFQVSGSSAK